MNCPTCGVSVGEHPASRCLDAWVAEKVMGCTVEWAIFPWQVDKNVHPFCACGGQVHEQGYSNIPGLLARYSTNRAAAFGPVDILIGREYEFVSGRVTWHGEWIWYALFSKDMFMNDKLESMAESYPLAICRAALKVVMESGIEL